MKTSFLGNVISSFHMPCCIVLRPSAALLQRSAIQRRSHVSQIAGQAISHATLQSDTTFIKLLHWARKTTHACAHTHKHTHSVPMAREMESGGRVIWICFRIWKTKGKIVWPWLMEVEEGGRDGRRKGKAAGEQERILMSWQQEHNSMTDHDGKKTGQAGNNGWCYSGPMLPQPCLQGFTFIPSSVNYNIAIWMDLFWRIVDACHRPDDAWLSQTTILLVAAQSKSVFFVLLYPFPKCCWLMLHPVHYQFHN